MKKYLNIVALVCSLAIFTACQTAPDGDNRKLIAAVKIAAYTGTSYALAEHPEWKPQFEEARRELAFIAGQPVIDFATVLAIVNRFPIKELKSDDAKIIITAGTLLLIEFGGDPVNLNVENMRPIVLALHDGVLLGLGMVPSRVDALNKTIAR